MSLYRFFTKASMPSRVPSLTDKESKTPTPVRTCGLSARARGRGYIATYVSRPPNLNPPIFLFTLVGANPPNLMPAKFSGYTVPPKYRTRIILKQANSERSEVSTRDLPRLYGFPRISLRASKKSLMQLDISTSRHTAALLSQFATSEYPP